MGLSQDNLHDMNIDIHQFGFQFGLHFSVWEKSDGRLDRKRRDSTGRKSASQYSLQTVVSFTATWSQWEFSSINRIQWGSQHPLGFLTLSLISKLHAKPRPGFLTHCVPQLEPAEYVAMRVSISVMLLSLRSLQPCGFLNLSSYTSGHARGDNRTHLIY